MIKKLILILKSFSYGLTAHRIPKLLKELDLFGDFGLIN